MENPMIVLVDPKPPTMNPAGLQDENARLRAALQFILGDNSQLHPMFGGTPNLRDIAYTAFMRAKEKNDEDGGATDWFTDTLPRVEKGIAMLREKFLVG